MCIWWNWKFHNTCPALCRPCCDSDSGRGTCTNTSEHLPPSAPAIGSSVFVKKEEKNKWQKQLQNTREQQWYVICHLLHQTCAAVFSAVICCRLCCVSIGGVTVGWCLFLNKRDQKLYHLSLHSFCSTVSKNVFVFEFRPILGMSALFFKNRPSKGTPLQSEKWKFSGWWRLIA